MKQELQFEVCANGVESCVAAQQGGAHRVELCAGIPEGGTTPSYGEIATARRELTTTRLNVIIRPRGGDFVYSKLELDRMTLDIDVARQLGAHGVVFGCLTPSGEVDMAACERLMRHARGMDVTFHRAFDRASNASQALEQIIALGIGRVLTSGQQPTALQGTALLRQLQEQAAGRIAIMAGCGVTEDNIAQIRRSTGVAEFHFSAREAVASAAAVQNSAVYMGTPGADEGTLMRTTARRVAATIAAARGQQQ